MPSARRLPPPWTVEEHNNACFIVKDATGQALAYVYFEDEPGRRSAAKNRRRKAIGDEVQLPRFTTVRAMSAYPNSGSIAASRQVTRWAHQRKFRRSLKQHLDVRLI